MALFSRKKDSADTSAKATASDAVTASTVPSDRNLSSVLIKPRVTEKAFGQSERNVYTFLVQKDATKHDIADAVRALYNVTPVKVNTVTKSPRRTISRMRGRAVTEKGHKKAYVYLKPGDSISLV